MKRELREEIVKDLEWQQSSPVARFIDKNQSLLKALGLAIAVVITGFSAIRLLKFDIKKKFD